VEARFSASRSMVVINRIVGNELNSSGLVTNTAVIRIRIEKLSEKASATSSSQVGSGTISTTRMAMMPIASPRSDLRISPPILPGEKSKAGLAVVPMSDMEN
jgi:hypothetical protein